MEAFTINQFCSGEKIGRSMFYKLAKMGKAPATYKVGSERRISREAWEAWRAERAAETESAAA